MKKKKIITIVSVTAVIVLIAGKLTLNYATVSEREEAGVKSQLFDAIPVKTIKVHPEDLAKAFVYSGTFVPKQDLKLMAQAQGQVKSLLVKKTQIITKGTLLATLDDATLTSQLLSARASLDKAIQDAQRYRNAFLSGGVTQTQVEDADLRVKNAEAQVTQIRQQMKNAQVVAPVSGIINDIYVEAGSFVSPGTAVLEIVDLTEVTLKVRLNQESLPSIHLGQEVRITTDVYPDKVFTGRIETVNVKSDASQKIEVGVNVKNCRETPLLAGMYGHAELLASDSLRNETALTIPREAIVGSTQDAKVFVLQADGTVSLRNIQTGRIAGNHIVVRHGLKPGEEIVTTGQINLSEGRKVIVKNN